MSIDLRNYVVAKWGTWTKIADAFTPSALKLASADDGLTLAGPLRVRVSVQAHNRFHLLGGSTAVDQMREAFSYVLDIAPGQTWTYPPAFAVVVAPPPPAVSGTGGTAVPPPAGSGSGAVVVGPPPPAETRSVHVATPVGGSPPPAQPVVVPTGEGGYWVMPPPPAGGAGQPVYVPPPPPGGGAGQPVYVPPPPPAGGSASPPVSTPPPASLARPPTLGTNAGFSIVIRAAGPDACADPCAADPCAPPDPCAPKPSGCGCGSGRSPCSCGGGSDRIPCDVAVASRPDMGSFFPSACEPCAPGAAVGMPAQQGVPLSVKPAAGGTVRTRYYNGMFITKEDIETDWRNARLKRALTNRAMGQGVVWGFSLGRDGEAICVAPGYGVDCCGEDVVLTTYYRVDTRALLADPAAAAVLAQPGAHRLHLLLEHYECPEQPRPVHGDPCSPETTRCEMSRIRETARLRLVAPCDIDTSGPIRDFLDEVAKLKNDPVVGRFFVPSDTASAPAPGNTIAPAADVPFTIEVSSAGATADPLQDATVAPTTSDTQQADLPTRIPGETFQLQYTVTVKAKPGFTFAATPIVQQVQMVDPNGAIKATNVAVTLDQSDATTLRWSFNSQVIELAFSDIPQGWLFEIRDWKMNDGPDWTFSSPKTTLDVSPLYLQNWESTPWGKQHANEVGQWRDYPYVTHVEVPASDVTVTGKQTQPPPATGPLPCLFEACDPDQAPRFPVTPPWLHEDPSKPGQAADPRVIVLAILYGWLAMEMARNQTGTPQAVQSTRLDAASAIYRATAKLLFATVPDTERYSLTDALQKLFQGWCKAFLYPGPKCQCEPHGVVVGCATVDGGEIQSVDPWGGRRWVIHYPLLSYWGQQLGIMPLDALASKFFDLVCCVSQLPAPKFPVRVINAARGQPLVAAPGIRASEPPVGRSSVVPLGAGTLIFDSPSNTAGRLTAMGIAPSTTVSLSPMDFVARVTNALAGASAAAPGAPMAHYTVLGMPELNFVAPADGLPAPSTPPPGQPAAGSLDTVVHGAVVDRPQRAAIPPLLRDVAESVATNVLSSMPIDRLGAIPRDVSRGLADVGATTVAGVLQPHPEDLHASALGGKSGPAFADVLDAAEKAARTVTKVVGDTLVTMAGDRRLTTRADLAKPEIAAEFSKMLSDRLGSAKLPVGQPEVATALADAIGT